MMIHSNYKLITIKNFDNEEDDEYISDEITEEIKIEDEDDDSFEL